MAGKQKRKADSNSEKPASSKSATNKKAKKTETIANEPQVEEIDNQQNNKSKSKKIDKEIISEAADNKRQTRKRAVTFLLPDNSTSAKDSKSKANKVEVKETKSSNKSESKKGTNSKSEETVTASTSVSKRAKRKKTDTSEPDDQSKRSAKVESGEASTVQKPRRSSRSSTRASTAASRSVLKASAKSLSPTKGKQVKKKTETKKKEPPKESKQKQSKSSKGKKQIETDKEILNDGDNNSANDDNKSKVSRLKKTQKETEQESKIAKSTSSNDLKRTTRKTPATKTKKSQSKEPEDNSKRTTKRKASENEAENENKNLPQKNKTTRKPKVKSADKENSSEEKKCETSNETILKSHSAKSTDENSNIDNNVNNEIVNQPENKTLIENAKIEENNLEEKPNDLQLVPSTSTAFLPLDKNIPEEKPAQMDVVTNENGGFSTQNKNDIPESNDNCINVDNKSENVSNETNCDQIDVNSNNKRKHDSLEDSSMPDKKKARVILFAGDLFTMGAQLSRELGPRERAFKGRRVTKMQPSRLKIGSKKIINLAAGALHTLAITESGQVISFGCNDDFVLGRPITQGDNMDEVSGADSDDEFIEDLAENEDDLEEVLSCTPLPVKEIKEKAIKVSAGDMHSAALCANGKVYIWGHFKDDSDKIGIFPDCQKLPTSFDYSPTILPRQIELDKFVVDIASGSNHFLMLTDEGKCYTIGDGSKGQLGRIPANQLKSIKTQRELFLKPHQVPIAEKIESIFASQWNSFAVTKNGTLYGWGLNNYFQLGIPTEVIVLKNNEKVENYLCALEPIRIPLSFAVSQVANGQQHTLLLDVDGNVYSCGSALYGKLGLGENINDVGEDNVLNKFIKIPSEDFNYERVTNITCGDFFSMVITETGKLYRWGEGNDSVDHAESDLFSPTLVEGAFADYTRFTSVSAGSQFSAMIGILEIDESMPF